MTIRALRRTPMPLRPGFVLLHPVLVATLLLAGCEGGRVNGNTAQAEPAMGDGIKGSRSIPCGPGAGAPRLSCLLEVEDHDGDLRLVLRKPDGGFQRLLWPKNGTLVPADGADPLETMALTGGGVEVRIGGWRYRMEKKGGGLP